MKDHCCHKCFNAIPKKTWMDYEHGMIVCKTCGNKRCPKATDHDLECTNSNQPGQTGSVYQ